MKVIGRTFAVLAAALVVVAVCMAVGWLRGSSGTMAGGMGAHGMDGEFNLGGIVQILPTLAIVLRRPNVGAVPAWLERRVARLPLWLRGASSAVQI